MDSATQFLLGASIAGATLGPRIGAKALILGGVLGTLPDLDSFIPMGNAIDNMTYHRGFSHSLFVLTAASPVLAFVLSKSFKSLAEHGAMLLVTVWLCLITHPLLDSLTTYGTQLFWPFNFGPPVAFPSIFIIDPLYTLLLLAGVLILAFGRKNRKSAVTTNRILLTIATLYLAAGMTAQVTIANRAQAMPALEGKRIFVQPTPFNILFWQVLAVDGDRYYGGFTGLFSDCRTIPLSSHARLKSLPGTAAKPHSVARLEWFTDGFYTYGNRQDVWSITDLRIGFHPAFVFSFDIGRGDARSVRFSTPVERQEGRDRLADIATLFERIRADVARCDAPGGAS